MGMDEAWVGDMPTKGAWMPAWNLLAIGDGFVEDINWAPEDVQVMKGVDGVSETTEDVRWGEASVGVGNMVV